LHVYFGFSSSGEQFPKRIQALLNEIEKMKLELQENGNRKKVKKQ